MNVEISQFLTRDSSAAGGGRRSDDGGDDSETASLLEVPAPTRAAGPAEPACAALAARRWRSWRQRPGGGEGLGLIDSAGGGSASGRRGGHALHRRVVGAASSVVVVALRWGRRGRSSPCSGRSQTPRARGAAGRRRLPRRAGGSSRRRATADRALPRHRVANARKWRGPHIAGSSANAAVRRHRSGRRCGEASRRKMLFHLSPERPTRRLAGAGALRAGLAPPFHKHAAQVWYISEASSDRREATCQTRCSSTGSALRGAPPAPGPDAVRGSGPDDVTGRSTTGTST
jgi:hypothetical protein